MNNLEPTEQDIRLLQEAEKDYNEALASEAEPIAAAIQNTTDSLVTNFASINQRIAQELNIPAMIDIPAKDSNKSLARIHAVPNPHHSRDLKVSTKLDIAKNHNTMQAVCSHTGIVIELKIPLIAGAVLDYYNPLAIYANAKGLVEQGPAYLQLLDTQILAGLWLTCYRHYGLVQEQSEDKQNASILNAMLRTAGKTILIDSLDTINHVHTNNSSRLPKFSLAYDAHKQSTGLGAALNNYTKACRTIIYPATLTPQQKADQAYINAYKSIKPKKKLYSEREWEEEFKANMREAKTLLNDIADQMLLPINFISFLKPLFVMKNSIITTMDKELRDKVVEKLKAYAAPQAQRLAVIVKASSNPYDIFGGVDQSLARASDNFANVIKPAKRSLADILAEKQAKRLAQENGQQVEAEQIEQQEARPLDLEDRSNQDEDNEKLMQDLIDDELDRDDMESEDSSLSESERTLLDDAEAQANGFIVGGNNESDF